jgi:ubiquitin carboxyl-terminal hydrolase 4/11/15
MLTTTGNSGAVSTGPSSVSGADQEMEDAGELPSIDEQVNIIQREMIVQLEDGMTGYVVATSWINRVLARSSEKDDHGPFEKDILEGDVGPIDNSSILLERG